MPYPAMSTLAAPARARSEIWRTALGVAAILAVYFALIALLLIALIVIAGPDIAAPEIGAMLSGRRPFGLVLTLFSFALLTLAIALTLRLLHRRSVLELLGPLRPAMGDFARVALPLLALALALLPFSADSLQVTRQMSLGDWLPWLAPALIGLLIQTSAEELAFRGYLQQQLAARFGAPLLWLVLPSALFGLVHYSPATFGPMSWPIVVWTGLFGLAAADLTARSGNLGAAVALHFVNNVSAILLVGLEGELGGLLLWSLALDPTDPAQMWPYLVIDAAWMLVSWLLARLVLRV